MWISPADRLFFSHASPPLHSPGGSSPARGLELVGQASVINGDTVEIQGTRIRLWGIDAPESSQFCRGEDSLPYRCGTDAANTLDAFIARRPVNCTPISLDRYGRTVATCTVHGADVAEWLVSNGLAEVFSREVRSRSAPSRADRTRDLERVLVEPWLYRVCIKSGGQPAGCSDEANANP